MFNKLHRNFLHEIGGPFKEKRCVFYRCVYLINTHLGVLRYEKSVYYLPDREGLDAGQEKEAQVELCLLRRLCNLLINTITFYN